MRVGRGMRWWQTGTFPAVLGFVGAWRDAGVAVVEAVVEGHGWRVGGLVAYWERRLTTSHKYGSLRE